MKITWWLEEIAMGGLKRRTRRLTAKTLTGAKKQAEYYRKYREYLAVGPGDEYECGAIVAYRMGRGHWHET